MPDDHSSGRRTGDRERPSRLAAYSSRSKPPSLFEDDLRNDRSGRRHSSKRIRSGSRERPRKRRSMSPEESDGERRGKHSRHRRDYRSRSENEREHRQSRRRMDRSRSRSRPRSSHRRSLQPFERSNRPLPSQRDAFQNEDRAVVKPDSVPEKQKPNYATTGKLAAASNTVQTAGQSIVLKYHEPFEARKPSARDRWRLYVFKDDEILETMELAEQSCWLFGRESAIVDVLIEHSSCSKQHAVIQFRYLEKKNEFGDKKGKVRPYVLDLESANGTEVNGSLIPEAKYVELRDKDVVKFGQSSREYMLQLPPAA